MSDKLEVVSMGFGETEDPLPHTPRLTKYRVFAGACSACGSDGRLLIVAGDSLILQCEKCGQTLDTSLPSGAMHEVTYVYWCNKSRFSSDEVVLVEEERRLIESLQQELGQYVPPRWAVEIVGGRCMSSTHCVNYDCIYLVKCQ